MIGFAGVTLVVALIFAAGFYFWAEKDEAYSVAQVRTCSAMLVRHLGDRAAELRARLRQWTEDPELQEAFRAVDTKLLRSREELLSRLISGASRVRFFIPGHLGDGVENDRPLSYAGLDLVDRAKRVGRVTPLEVHRVGQEDMHLAVAGPVLDGAGGEVLGVVHVSLPISVLPSLKGMGGDRSRIVYQQRVGDEMATVDSGRHGPAPDGEPAYRDGIPGTRLQVVAWITAESTLSGAVSTIAVGFFAMAVAVIGLVLWFTLRSARNAMAFDYAGIVAMVEDAVNDRPVRRVKCRLAETQPVAGIVRKMLCDSGQTTEASRRTTAPAAVKAHRPAVGQEAEPVYESHEPQVGADAGNLREEALTSTRADAPEETPAPIPDAAGPAPVEVEPLDLAEIDLDELLPMEAEVAKASAPEDHVPAAIFRAYDIRGIVGKDLNIELARYIGLAVGSEVVESGEPKVAVARDTRPSGVGLVESLIAGLRETGCDVTDLGVAPTPLLYFATRYAGNASGVMVTGSHNPKEYNGLKVVVGGVSLEGERIAGLRRRMLDGAFAAGDGARASQNLAQTYVARVEKNVAIARSMSVVVDCGNGAASVVAGDLYRALDCEVIEINCDPDAGFPDGCVPDPSREECLEALRQRVVKENADIGFAFDGDADRLGVVDSTGKIIWTDRVLMLLAADVLSRHPGTDVVFDVKCSRHLGQEIVRYGGRPVMWRSGHSPLKAKLAETGGLLAGEWSGHIVFRERWYGFDDALYAGARLLEVLALDPRSTAEVFADFPEAISTPELIVPMEEGEAAGVVDAVSEIAEGLAGVDLHRIDGLRLEYERGWGLIRASNTQPALVFRFEADDDASLDKLKALFREMTARAAPDLELPF
jgi:phosphomannomutase/phosphoglucomutase